MLYARGRGLSRGSRPERPRGRRALLAGVMAVAVALATAPAGAAASWCAFPHAPLPLDELRSADRATRVRADGPHDPRRRDHDRRGPRHLQPLRVLHARHPQLCIPALGEEDGPAGVADGLTGVTQLPAGVALAATLDPSLAPVRPGDRRRGGRQGRPVNLGPTVNIDRDPRWGRSFETYTEDPFLNARWRPTRSTGSRARARWRRSSTTRCTTRRPTATPPRTT